MHQSATWSEVLVDMEQRDGLHPAPLRGDQPAPAVRLVMIVDCWPSWNTAPNRVLRAKRRVIQMPLAVNDGVSDAVGDAAAAPPARCTAPAPRDRI